MYSKPELHRLADAIQSLPDEHQESLTNQLNDLVKMVGAMQQKSDAPVSAHSLNDGKEFSLPANVHLRFSPAGKALKSDFKKDPLLGNLDMFTGQAPSFVKEIANHSEWFCKWLQETPANSALFSANPAACFITAAKERKVDVSGELISYLKKGQKDFANNAKPVPGLQYQHITTSFYPGDNNDNFDGR